MKNWAEKEIELACKHAAKTGRKEGEFEYKRACYKSALKAYNSLMEDGHSEASIQFTKDILNRLIDGKPIIQIEDTDDIWLNGVNFGDYVSYQCSRMSSLFKKVYNDEHVEYEDIRFLGEIYISYERCCEQAEEFGHSIRRELCYLAVHGLLHLLGYDHMNEEDKKVMRTLEEEILNEYDIKR